MFIKSLSLSVSLKVFLKLRSYYTVKNNNASNLVANAAFEIETLLYNRSKALKVSTDYVAIPIHFEYTFDFLKKKILDHILARRNGTTFSKEVFNI